MQNDNTNETATAEASLQTAEPISVNLTIKWMPDGFAIKTNVSKPEVLQALTKLKDIDSLNHEETMINIITAAIGIARQEAQEFMHAAMNRRRLGRADCDCPKCVAKRQAENAGEESK